MIDKIDIKLSELIDVKTLQSIQDGFAHLTGVAALITEPDGTPITVGALNSDYCYKYTRGTDIGCSMCKECDLFGVEEAIRRGETHLYTCHAGLVDFAAPILIDGQLIGCFLGGQVISGPIDESFVRNKAIELGIDPDEYVAAAHLITSYSTEYIENAAKFMAQVTEILSNLAYSNYKTAQANTDLELAAKTQGDFLANMSHEIRTPMNAVVGFTELALREEVSPTVKDYLEQIKSSSNALLSLINDILDFSKMKSQQLDIIPVNYEPLSVIDDVASITMTRLTDKDVELLLDIDPNIPSILEGDNMRIKQILINLCNNATKFTKQGNVTIKVSYEWLDYANVSLRFSVSDTGIGIKEEDIEKIFNSFTQVDTKRNRNIEGSGLGLAISKNLLNLMGSEIEVSSEYGVGSTFSFAIKQRVIDSKPSIIVDSVDNIVLGGAFANEDVRNSFVNSAKKIGLTCETFLSRDYDDKVADVNVWSKDISESQESFFVIEQQIFDPTIMEQYYDNKSQVIILAETYADVREYSVNNNILVLRKPISVMSLGNLLNHKSLRFNSRRKSENLYDFIAPESKILIVDDNVVNLTVARGLLVPIRGNIDIAKSGKEALQLIKTKKYDLIFMDHMMPEMDGIEATHIIREKYPDYSSVPIIALTANAMSGVKEQFIAEGMNDFVPKPIEVKVLLDKVREYLPAGKLKDLDGNQIDYQQNQSQSGCLNIADLDTSAAIELMGSEALFKSVLKIYYDSIDDKANTIERLYKEGDWAKYSIEVHALKSTSRQIGAKELGDMAYKLEMAGKNEDIYIINAYTEQLLKKYRSYKSTLASFIDTSNDNEGVKLASKDDLLPIFNSIRVACENLDFIELEKQVDNLGQFDFPEIWQGKYKSIKRAVVEMDIDEIIDVLDSWN